MEEETTHIRVYKKDWQEFNLYVSLKNMETGELLSFAEAFHFIVEDFIKKEVEKFRRA